MCPTTRAMDALHGGQRPAASSRPQTASPAAARDEVPPATTTTSDGPHAAPNESGENVQPKQQRPRSALFGRLKPEGRLKARALEALRQVHAERRVHEDHAAKAREREARRQETEMESQRFRERLEKKQEKEAAEEKDLRQRRAEAARRRVQRRQQAAEEAGSNAADGTARPESAASSSRPPRPPPVQTDPPESEAAGPSSPYIARHTLYFQYRGMPRSQKNNAICLSDMEYNSMTIAALKERIASNTGVQAHRSCLMLHDTPSGFETLKDDSLVCEQLGPGAKLLLQLSMSRASSASGTRSAPPPQPAAARQQVNDEWIHGQTLASLWRGRRKDEFPPAETVTMLNRDAVIRMLRQANADVNTACHEDDLRKQLSESSHLWEAERVLACQTPDEILRVPQDSGPLVVKAAFRKVSMLVHPDKNRAENASKAMQAVTGAFRSMYLDSSSARPKKSVGVPPKAPNRPASAVPTAAQPQRPEGYRPESAGPYAGVRRTSSNNSRFSATSEPDAPPQAPRKGWYSKMSS